MQLIYHDTPDGQQLAQAALQANHTTQKRNLAEQPQLPTNQEPALLYSSIEDAATIQKSTPRIVVWSSWENYRCQNYLARLGDLLLNDEYALWPLNELRRLRWLAYRTFARDTKIFIRPDAGNKPFAGQLLDLQDFDRFCDQYANTNEMALVAKPQMIQGEWRCFISAQTGYITGSLYRYQNNLTIIPAVPPQVQQLANEAWKRGHHPDPIYSIDVAESESPNDNRWQIIEINSFSTAGLYASNPHKLIAAAAAALSSQCTNIASSAAQPLKT